MKDNKLEQSKEWAEWQSIVHDVLNLSQKFGATSAEASLGTESGLTATARLGEVETIEYQRDKSLSITVYKNQQKGSASTTDFHKEALESAVKAAYRIADYAESDPCAGLADKDLLAKDLLATDIRKLDLYHPFSITAEEAVAIAKQCEEAGRQKDPRIVNSEGATFTSHNFYHVYGNTLGFLGAFPTTRHSLSCILVAKENNSNNSMERDYDYTVAREYQDLTKASLVGENAAKRTLRRLNARKISTRKAPVLLDADIARGLWGNLVGAITGGNLYRKSSFLLDQLGKKILPDFVEIKEDPFLPKGLGSTLFDHEGVATKPRSIVTDGILQGYVLSTYSARKLGLKSTGNSGGVHNLMISHTDPDFKSLLKKMDTGLWVTELLGQGVNLVTGDYSRGAVGFWIEKGEIAYPVHEITIAGNLKDMLLGIVGIGADIDRRGKILTGSILIDQMTIAGS